MRDLIRDSIHSIEEKQFRPMQLAIDKVNDCLGDSLKLSKEDYFASLRLIKNCYELLNDDYSGENFLLFKNYIKWKVLLSPPEYAFYYDIHLPEIKNYALPQYPIGRFFVDFYLPTRNLVIEIDGKEFHSGKVIMDDYNRDKELEKMGYNILRLTAVDVFKACEGTSEKIEEEIQKFKLNG